jgi:type I restriction enzyme, S subunit
MTVPKWRTATLGEVARRIERAETPVAGKVYRQIGVKLWGAGAYERETIDGVQTKYAELCRAETGDIIVNKIWARNGSVAVVQESEAGCYGSGEFPMFRPNADELESRWIHWLTKTPGFWAQCDDKSRGTSGKNRIKPEQFLRVEIPLPPLAEQRRVVAQIEELAAQIHEARELRSRAAEQTEAFVLSVHADLSGKRTKKLGEILKLDEETTTIQTTESYPQVGVRSFGGGLFPKGAVKGTDTTYRTFNRLYEGALLLSQVKGWEGAVAISPPELAGWFVSPEYRTFRCIETESRPRYLAPLIRTEWFWSKLGNATRGVGARRERTRPEQFLNIELPMPDVERQKFGEVLFAEVDALKRLQAVTAAELDALLPAILDKAFKGEL